MLVVATDGDATASLLSERNCQLFRAASLNEALAGRATDAPFDAVVIFDGFEDLADPIEALRELAKLLAENGALIVVAENVGHASVRLRAVLGHVDASGAVPARRYDLSALERVVAEAGLHVTERLRVIEPLPAEELERVAPGLAAVMVGDDAATRRFVVVTNRSEATTAGETVAEALQRVLTDLTAQVADLDATKAALAEATATVRDQGVELDARKDALVERIELIERLYAERRHLELEIVVKDDYISILRRDRNDWRNIHAALQNDMDELKRSRHYKVAAGMHAAITRIPLLHRVARFAAKRVMAARGRDA